jgi:branched-chain amino acid transport system substrate-binding protein
VKLALAALLSALAAAPGATPGVSSTQIVIGGTGPLSGPESLYAPVLAGAKAYFAYVNEHGGVYGRKIVYKIVDDGYDPSRTVQATVQLVQQDHVLAIFNTVGTEHSLAIRQYLNAQHVPELFVGSGADAIASQTSKYPWTMGFLPSFSAEGALYGREVARAHPGARVAVLYENSEYGKELLAGLQRGLGSRGRVVAKASYEVTDTDVSSQVAKLRGTRASVFALLTLPKQTIQGMISAVKLGWRPKWVVSSVSIDPFVMNVVRASAGKNVPEGALSSAFLHDPTNPTQTRLAAVKLYRQILRRYAPGADWKAVAHIYGMAAAYTFVDALRHAGRNPTRDSLLRAATHLNEVNPFLLPGIRIKTSPSDYYPMDKARFVRYRHGLWVLFGNLVTARP